MKNNGKILNEAYAFKLSLSVYSSGLTVSDGPHLEV